MGDCETWRQPVWSHPWDTTLDSTGILTIGHESGSWTLSGGQFDWGGRLLKSNGGAQRFPQHGRKSCEECKGRRELDCETYRSSRTKVGLSDPVVPRGRAIAQRIKATLGITG